VDGAQGLRLHPGPRGPNRVGPAGLLQPFADVIKLVFKEDLRPKSADAFLFAIAPIISTATAFAAFYGRAVRRRDPVVRVARSASCGWKSPTSTSRCS
jgi:NADH:ubiquinone oxidoreductase subunit H